MTVEFFLSLLTYMSVNKFPDLHIVTNKKPIIRNHSGDLNNIDSFEFDGDTYTTSSVSKFDVQNIIKFIAGEEGFAKFETNMELDLSYNLEGKDRFRVNCYIDSSGFAIAMRIIPKDIPSMDTLGLGDSIADMCKQNKGLILVTGPTGSGKSTNLAAMIDYINTNYKKHIITIEDPVEFSFTSKNCLVNQREIGNHTKGFQEAIRASLREDPDIVMVGEMRDPETIRAALTLAETGHLVLSTLHTNDTVQSIDRIIDVFPAGQQEQIRMQLALSLIGIISQRLIPRIDKEGRIASREILINNDAIRNLILTGQSHQVYSVIEVSSKKGMILMDKYLEILYKKQIISRDTLMSYARDKEGLEMIIGTN